MPTRPWLVTDAPSLELDLTVSQPASISVVSSALSLWKDQSPKTRNGLPSSSSPGPPTFDGPVLNGFTTVNYSATVNQKLRIDQAGGGFRAGIPVLGSLMFAVFNPGASNAFRFLCGGYNGNRYDLFFTNGNNQLGYHVGGGDKTFGSALGTSSTWRIVAIWVSNTGVVTPILDGTDYSTTTTSAGTIQGVDLGGYAGGQNNQYQGLLAEYGIISAATRDIVDRTVASLHWQYGLQANMPASQPYKAVAPTVTTGGGIILPRRRQLIL